MSWGPYGIHAVPVCELFGARDELRRKLPDPWQAEVYWDDHVHRTVLHVWRGEDQFPCFLMEPGDWVSIDPTADGHRAVVWHPAASAPEHIAFFSRISVELSAMDAVDGAPEEAAVPANVFPIDGGG